MKRKQAYIVRPDEVRVVRTGHTAAIHYHEEGICVHCYDLGPEIETMTDEEIVTLHNDRLRERAAFASTYKHTAVEIPLGSSQIEYFAPGYQWTPRGSVLRCLIEDNENGELVVVIDDHELSLEEFGSLLMTYAGWGMRIEFVPDDAIHRRPVLEVREPEESSTGS